MQVRRGQSDSKRESDDKASAMTSAKCGKEEEEEDDEEDDAEFSFGMSFLWDIALKALDTEVSEKNGGVMGYDHERWRNPPPSKQRGGGWAWRG